MGDLSLNFSHNEFPEGEAVHADPRLVEALQAFRTELGSAIAPSRVEGALARFDDGSLHSEHSARQRLSTAVDVFPENPIQAFLLAPKYFGGYGIYLDTRGNDGKTAIMLHLDLRKEPLWWIRINGKYIYPKTEVECVAALEVICGIYP